MFRIPVKMGFTSAAKAQFRKWAWSWRLTQVASLDK
jgi:hypothetical protein